MNPLMALYAKMVPTPNQNFVENGQQPSNNFYQGGQPDSPKSQQYGFRLDYNATRRIASSSAPAASPSSST